MHKGAVIVQAPRDTPSTSATQAPHLDNGPDADAPYAATARRLADRAIAQLVCATYPPPPGPRVTDLSKGAHVTDPVAYLTSLGGTPNTGLFAIDGIRWIHYTPLGGAASASALPKLLRGLAKRERMRCFVLIRKTQHVERMYEGLITRAASVFCADMEAATVVPIDGVLVPPNVHIVFWTAQNE